MIIMIYHNGEDGERWGEKGEREQEDGGRWSTVKWRNIEEDGKGWRKKEEMKEEGAR
jgi:hypothetical protein